MEENKEAFQFLFTVTLQQCSIKIKNEWKPDNLQITWKRGERRKSFDPFEHEKIISCIDGEQMNIDFEGCHRSMLVTLYENDFGFKEREYEFIFEEINGPIFKRLALHSFNIAEYVSMDCESFPMSMKFKALSQNISDISVTAQVRCEFLKKGSYRDSDMASNFSHISDSKSDCESEDDGEEEVNEHVTLMQSRANKTRTQWFSDLDERNFDEVLPRYNNIPSYAFVPQVEERSIQTKCLPIGFSLMNFDKKKEKSVPNNGDIVEIVHQVKDNDFVENESMQIQRLTLENDALKVKNVHLLSLVDTYKVDVRDLQTEISKLHLLIQSLKIKLQQSNQNGILSSTTTLESLRNEQLYGWLCKQGVKGGRIGRRLKRRWFCLEDRHLCYYKYPGRERPQGSIDLDKVIGVVDSATQDKNNGSFNIMTSDRIYQLTAYDEEDKRRWINMLDHLCSKKPRLKLKEGATSSLPR